jgi:hypothetical protein
MQIRHTIITLFAATAILLGGAGAIAAANPSLGPAPQAPGVQGPTDAPDVPGQPDLPEPGDTPDAPPPAAPAPR